MAYIVKGEVYRRLGTGEEGKPVELVRVVSVFKNNQTGTEGVRMVKVAKLYGNGAWIVGTAAGFEDRYVLHPEQIKKQESGPRKRSIERKAGAAWGK